jgi:hypothetical protein
VLPAVSRSYPRPQGRFPRVTHPSATHPLLSASDLHVLGAPPAFVLSQDQTLSLIADHLGIARYPSEPPKRFPMNTKDVPDDRPHIAQAANPKISNHAPRTPPAHPSKKRFQKRSTNQRCQTTAMIRRPSGSPKRPPPNPNRSGISAPRHQSAAHRRRSAPYCASWGGFYS